MMSEEVHTLSAEELSKVVVRVVRVEGPVHENEITRRITTLWGLSRSGRRISDAVHEAITYTENSGAIRSEEDFYWYTEQTEFPLRNRDQVESSGLKKPEMLPPRELQSGICEFVEHHVSATSEETARAIGRMLGFRSTSRQLRERIEEEIESLITQGELVEENGVLRRQRSNNKN